jgi:hypothetical protein
MCFGKLIGDFIEHRTVVTINLLLKAYGRSRKLWEKCVREEEKAGRIKPFRLRAYPDNPIRR